MRHENGGRDECKEPDMGRRRSLARSSDYTSSTSSFGRTRAGSTSLFIFSSRGKHHVSMTSHRQAVADLTEALAIQREIDASGAPPEPGDPVVSAYPVLRAPRGRDSPRPRDRLFEHGAGQLEQRAVLVAIK